MSSTFRTYDQLSVIERIYLKEIAMRVWDKRIHFVRPDFLNKLNELQIYSLLSR